MYYLIENFKAEPLSFQSINKAIDDIEDIIMKRRADQLEDLRKLFSDQEFKEAGINDTLDYVHEDLTVKEIRDYIKFFNGPLMIVLSKIRKLRQEHPPHVWKNFKAFNLSNRETRTIKTLQLELIKVWRTDRPRIEDREIIKK